MTGEGDLEEVQNGQTLQMIANVQPNNASNKAVTWSVTNIDGTETDKATISETGLLTAIKEGKVNIVATAKDGSGVRGELEITISVPAEVDFIQLRGENHTSLDGKLDFNVSYHEQEGYDKFGFVKVTGEISQAELEGLNLALNAENEVVLSVWVKAPIGAYQLTGGGYTNATDWNNTSEGYWSTLNPVFVKNVDSFELVDAYNNPDYVGLYSFEVEWMDEHGVLIEKQLITLDASAVDIITEADLTAYNAALAAVVQADYTLESWEAYQLVVAANEVTVAYTQEDVEAATANITAAQAELVTIIDANLQAAKAAAAALTPADYVDYSAVTTALEMPETSDAEKIAKTAAINDAIAELTEVVEANLVDYDAALAAVVEADYTVASWESYQVVVAANVVTVANTQEEVNTATGLITAAQADLVEAVDFIKLSGTNYTSLQTAGLIFQVSYQDHNDYDKLGVVRVTGEISQSKLKELNADGVDLSVWVKAPVGAYSLTGGGYTNAATWDNTGEGYWSTLNPLFVKNGDKFELVDAYNNPELAGLYSFDVQWMDADGVVIIHQAITIDARAVSITE